MFAVIEKSPSLITDELLHKYMRLIEIHIKVKHYLGNILVHSFSEDFHSFCQVFLNC